ncbi:hypothetical protein [Saccharothrix lopnurensis]|uniref:Integral membrane protein n=1 Tax=Saccharothrix lopnurensis TaxID=1670621 RepID=A0ABW1P9X4_9PSEU
MAVLGGVVWALLRFGVPVVLTEEEHPARPVVEALSWFAGIAGLLVAVAALVVAVRQRSRDNIEVGDEPSSASSAARTQTATGGGVVFTGDVTGGSGSGATTGVHIGGVEGPPDPPAPARP